MAMPTGDVITLLAMSLGLAYFIYLIISDVWSSIFGKPCSMWISGKALILSALTIQVLTYLDYKNISISDKPDAEQYAKLLGNQLVIDSGRLVICVFIGYLLPGMARAGSAAQWGDIAALVISLFTAVTSELYYIHKSDKKTSVRVTYDYTYEFFWEVPGKPHIKLWFIVSSVVVLVLTVVLIFLLVSAILAGKTVRGMLSKRVGSVIKRCSNKYYPDSTRFEDYLESFEDDLKKLENYPQRLEDYLGKFEDNLGKFEDEIIRSWVLCRVGKPQYVIARSVLSSSAALLVTFCIVLLVFKGIYLRSMNILHHYDRWDWLRHTTFALQCTFVLLGWAVILWRYLTSVFYFPRALLSGKNGRDRIIGCLRCGVEDFWTRSISELIDMYDLHRWRQNQPPQSGRNCSGGIVGCTTLFKFHKLLCILWHLQNFMVLFSKCCWFISWMVLRCDCIQKCVLGLDRLSLYSSYQDETRHYGEFLKYKDALQHMCMPGEHPVGLWLANERGFRQAQERFRSGSDKRWDYLTLFLNNRLHRKSIVSQLQAHQLDLVKEYFPSLNENCWKITAVSLLRILIEVSSLNQDSDIQVQTAIRACQQAWDLMRFPDIEQASAEIGQPITIDVVEVFDYELDQVSMSADNEFKKLLAGKGSSKDKLSSGHEQSAHQIIHKLLRRAEVELRAQKLLPTQADFQAQEDVRAQEDDQVPVPLDSIDWNAIVPAYNMYRVCKVILDAPSSQRNDNVNRMVNNLCNLLGSVIGDCLLKLPGTIVRSCRKWAVDYREENIWEAIYIAGQIRAVLKRLIDAKIEEQEVDVHYEVPQIATAAAL